MFKIIAMDKHKDIPEIIADMLIKQDQTIDAVNKLSEKMEEVVVRVDITNERLAATNEKLETTNNILQNFMEVSVKQWEAQARFNEILNEKVDKSDRKIEDVDEKTTGLEDRIRHLENLEARVSKLERLLNAG